MPSLQEYCTSIAACATGVAVGACYRRPSLPAARCGHYRSTAPSAAAGAQPVTGAPNCSCYRRIRTPVAAGPEVACAQHFLSLSPFDKQPCISVYLVLQLQVSLQVVSWMLPPLRIAGHCPAGKRPWSRGLHEGLGGPHVAPQAARAAAAVLVVARRTATMGFKRCCGRCPTTATLCGHGALPGHPMAGAAGGKRWHARLEPTTSSALPQPYRTVRSSRYAAARLRRWALLLDHRPATALPLGLHCWPASSVPACSRKQAAARSGTEICPVT